MECLVVEFRIHPQQVAAFDAAIRANARASRETEPGCRQFDVCRDPGDDSLFYLYELYDDDAAVQAEPRSMSDKPCRRGCTPRYLAGRLPLE